MRTSHNRLSGGFRSLVLGVVLLSGGGLVCAEEGVDVDAQRISLMLDGRLSDPAALPAAVSSPQLDASLAQLHRDKHALEQRLTLLERQWHGTVYAAARARQGMEPTAVATSSSWRPNPFTGTVDAPAWWLRIALTGVLALVVLGLVFSYLRRKALDRRPKTQPEPAVPGQWQDIDFDFSPIGSREGR